MKALTMQLLPMLICCLLALVIPANAEEQYTDATGYTLPYGLDTQRIVSLAPNVTEMIYYIGLGNLLVGRSDYCNYPPEVEQVPTVGGFVDSSLEQIVALQPDLVVAYQGNSRELIDHLRELGINTLALAEPRDLRQIGDQMLALGQIAGDHAADLAKVVSWQIQLDTLTKPPADPNDAPSILFGYPAENTYTCGGDSFIADLIHRAGCSCVTAELSGRWPVVSAEYILASDPDWLLTATSCTSTAEAANIAEARSKLIAELQADEVWRNLSAVRQEHVILIDADLMLRPGPHILDALDQLQQNLHRFSNVHQAAD